MLTANIDLHLFYDKSSYVCLFLTSLWVKINLQTLSWLYFLQSILKTKKRDILKVFIIIFHVLYTYSWICGPSFPWANIQRTQIQL